MKRACLLILLYLTVFQGCTKKYAPVDFDTKVETSVRNQLATYPKSRLQDLYKNFFQDRFGPGHLITDTAMVDNYLKRELASYTEPTGALVEPIGWEGNFYRVNTDVVKFAADSAKETVYKAYLDAFIESANTTPTPRMEDWQKEWDAILEIIEQMNLHLPDYEADKANIQTLITSGKYAGHHSKAFEATYHPHYRIIRRELYESADDGNGF
ncbi:hypothetical protein SAMD00024442_23_29 [Candidatus Symbiothrix dinenymphae]|nr:hypothetical protein SAMD00024442_23_29 [Candidatus Symbiothrix dinenymphae]